MSALLETVRENSHGIHDLHHFMFRMSVEEMTAVMRCSSDELNHLLNLAEEELSDRIVIHHEISAGYVHFSVTDR